MKFNYNILFVGAGKIGTIRAIVARKFSPNSKLYIYDIDLKKARELSKKVNGITVKSFNKVIKDQDIDIVVIATVNKYSKNFCINALKNGKHVLCEKPMGRNYKEAQAIVKAIKKYKKLFKCGFNHRYHLAVQEAYKLCKENKIGKVLFIRAIYGHGGRGGYTKEWRAKKSLSGGGELLDQGSHLIDLCQWFFNFEEIKRTSCITKTMFWKMNVEDNAFIMYETKGRKVAQLHTSWTQWKNLFKFEIFGTKGSIEINGLGKSYGIESLKVFKRYQLGKPPHIFEKQYTSYDNSWETEWLDFLKSIKLKNETKYLLSNEKESLQVMKIISNLYDQ